MKSDEAGGNKLDGKRWQNGGMELFMFCLVLCIGLVNYLAKDAGSFIGGVLSSLVGLLQTGAWSFLWALLGLELLVGIWLADFISGMIHLNLDYQTVSNRELLTR